MPGRFLVFMPTVDHVGVSRKIESRDERARLRGIVREFREAHGFTGGVIIRTAAAGRPKEDIISDLEAFHAIWTDIRQKMESSRAPAVVYREQSLVGKLLRDLADRRIPGDPHRQRAGVPARARARQRILPNLAPKVKCYDKPFPIFEEYGVQAEIDKALKSKVWLKSGGSIVINQTEALVAIDVNTGRYVGKKTSGRLEDTIVKTNLEAVKEIVRQVRLRDLGGIIVLDFIDMEEKKNRQKVLQAVEQELKKDRSPSKALQVSDFGLVIITRKRVKQSLERVLTEPCPYCSGTGVIKSSSTICYEILSEVRKIGPELNGHRLLLRVNPDIARALKEEESAVLAATSGSRSARTSRSSPTSSCTTSSSTSWPCSTRVRRSGKSGRRRYGESESQGSVAGVREARVASSRQPDQPDSADERTRCDALRRGGQMNQVVRAGPVDPDPHEVVALEHLDARSARGRFSDPWRSVPMSALETTVATSRATTFRSRTNST